VPITCRENRLPHSACSNELPASYKTHVHRQKVKPGSTSGRYAYTTTHTCAPALVHVCMWGGRVLGMRGNGVPSVSCIHATPSLLGSTCQVQHPGNTCTAQKPTHICLHHPASSSCQQGATSPFRSSAPSTQHLCTFKQIQLYISTSNEVCGFLVAAASRNSTAPQFDPCLP